MPDDSPVKVATQQKIQNIYQSRDDLIKNHLAKMDSYIELQQDLQKIKPPENTNVKLNQFIEKMSKNIQVLQFIDDQLYTRARVIDFNFQQIEDPESLKKIMDDIEFFQTENSMLKKLLKDSNDKYEKELSQKNHFLTQIVDKNIELENMQK